MLLVCKRMQSILKIYVSNNFCTYSTLSRAECGFVTHHYCLVNLLFTVWQNESMRTVTGIVHFLNFTQASDFINHAIMLNKCKAYCLHHWVSGWIHRLLNRSFVVKVGHARSSPDDTCRRAPQRSVIGSPLFLICINVFMICTREMLIYLQICWNYLCSWRPSRANELIDQLDFINVTQREGLKGSQSNFRWVSVRPQRRS